MALSNTDFNFGHALVTTLAEDIRELGYRDLAVRYDVEDRLRGRFGAVRVSRRPHQVEIHLGAERVIINVWRTGYGSRVLHSESYDLADPQSLDRAFAVIGETFG